MILVRYLFTLIISLLWPAVTSPLSPVLPTVSILPTPTAYSLSQRVQINTAFVPQAPENNWAEPWQDACEEAALLTVHYYYSHQTGDPSRIKTDLLSLFDFEQRQGWSKDIDTSQMAYLASHYYHYQTQIISHPGLVQLKTILAQDTPVIVPADGKILFAENHYFSHGGPTYHNIVLLGFDDTRQQFIVHDVGTRHGAYYRYSYQLLLSSIHDFGSGSPNVLILRN